MKKYSCLGIHCKNGDFANCINRFILQKYSGSKVVTFGLINGVEAVECDEGSDNIHLEQNLKEMKTAIHATLFHVASSEKNESHDHCPKGATSWCRYQC